MDTTEREATAAALLLRVNKIALAFVRQYPAYLNREDALSIAGLAVTIALEHFDPKRGNLEQFADMITRRRMTSELRAAFVRNRHEDHSISIESDVVDDANERDQRRPLHTAIAAESVETALLTLEAHKAIVRGLGKVSDTDLALLRDRGAGLTYAAIGKKQGIAKQSTWERVSKARAVIQAELEAAG